MLTPAERNSLLLSLGFLLVGAGIKAWKKWHVEIGPFDPAANSAARCEKARTGMPAPAVPEDGADADSSRAGPASPDSSTTTPPDPLASAADADTLARLAAPTDRKPSRSGKAKVPKAVPACPVDLNAASEDRLANLPGVGPRTAAAIAAYRKAHGPYRNLRELLQVKGIGEKKLARIAPCLILSGAGAEPPREQASVVPERVGAAGAAGP